MAREVQQFLNAATNETIRCTNQFEIELVSGVPEIDALMEDTMMFGQSISIPNRTVEYAPVSFKGFEMGNLVPTRITMGNEHTMSVIDDVNGTHRRVFLAMMNHVMNFDIEGGSVFEGDRGVNPNSILRIRLFDKDNKTVIQTYKFYNICVSNVGETQLDYNGGDVSKFDVTFKSTYFTLEDNKKGGLTELK